MSLISISELIETLKKRGLVLTKGDAKVHLRYLGRLGLIPPTKKRKVGGALEGHYPEWTVARLEEIAELKKQGLTHTQMKLLWDTRPVVSAGYRLAGQTGRGSRSLSVVNNRPMDGDYSFEYDYPRREIGVNRLFLMLNTAVLIISLLVLSKIAAGGAETQVVVVPTKDYSYLFSDNAASQEPLRLAAGGERKIVKTDLR